MDCFASLAMTAVPLRGLKSMSIGITGYLGFARKKLANGQERQRLMMLDRQRI
jgi:hypothetical protein